MPPTNHFAHGDVPLQHLVPRLEPMQLAGDVGPEASGSAAARAELVVVFLAADVSVLAELRWGGKELRFSVRMESMFWSDAVCGVLDIESASDESLDIASIPDCVAILADSSGPHD